MQNQVVEVAALRLLVHAEVAVELGRDEQLPHLAADGGQLGRVEGRHLRMLVEQVLETGQVVVGVGAGHGREQVIDDHRVRAALGLRALAGVVDDEGVDERQVAEGDVGPAVRRQPQPLPREPLERAVLAEVHHGMDGLAEVLVEREVALGRRQVGRVVHGDGVLAEPARRLDGD